MSPTYNFICENCGYHEESYRSIKTPKVTKCPSCGEHNLIKCVGKGTGFLVKGKGIYREGWSYGEKWDKGDQVGNQ